MEYVESSSVIISGFSLTNDKNVLDSLQNVFFSIDLENGLIFNADSLPFGTKVTRLVPKISAASTASEVNLKFHDSSTMRDTTINYLKNSTDSVDFSNGPVILTVKSQSGAVTKEYKISVNVHKIKADSLAWYSMQQAPLPSTFTSLDAQCTAKLGDVFFCLSTDGKTYSLATTTNPLDPQWNSETLDIPFVPNVESLRASTDVLYILSADGDLYSSADGKQWMNTGVNWINIYGNYNDQIFGAKATTNGYEIASYPSGSTWKMPNGFPLTGTSLTACYTTEMAYDTQMVMLGGRSSDGNLVSGAWSFDGNSWANVSAKPMPEGLEYVAMVPYSLVEVPSTTWSPTQFPVLFAMGGQNASGKINEIVYYSRDWGMTWHEAPDLVQLPEKFPLTYSASVFQHSSVMEVASRSSLWTEIGLRSLPEGGEFILPASRSDVSLITQWECPSIYVFGGRDESGKTLNQMWRGVINYFTFRPVQ
ncbi:MAG: hypothetical protein K2K37_07055 [Muribaculaceae bacterium]|nr:hypothetical protein [Muribaculaceae bacterium]